MGHSFFIIVPTLYFVINFATSYSIILTCKAKTSPQLSEVMFECPYKSTLVKHKLDSERYSSEATKSYGICMIRNDITAKHQIPYSISRIRNDIQTKQQKSYGISMIQNDITAKHEISYNICMIRNDFTAKRQIS